MALTAEVTLSAMSFEGDSLFTLFPPGFLCSRMLACVASPGIVAALAVAVHTAIHDLNGLYRLTGSIGTEGRFWENAAILPTKSNGEVPICLPVRLD